MILPALLLTAIASVGAQTADTTWRSDWAVADGFAIDIDSRGFELPTAIAFVPNPGAGPKDPLYYVTELKGTIRVVTNDRTVLTFARDFFSLPRSAEFPDQQAEVGLAGICLAPSHGYVFVTFAYQDAGGQLRNNIVRFGTQSGSFGVTPTGQRAFTEIFERDHSAVSHQIGPCEVADGHLFVSVGDAMRPFDSRRLESTGGKLLRMTFDGAPASDNPFRSSEDRDQPRNYVWAYGLRNPFSLVVLGERAFVADNGNAIDRFLEVEKAGDYHWNGSDWSIGVDAAAVISPSVGPVQMEYVPASATHLDEWAGRFFVATSGRPGPEQSSRPGAKGVMALPYDLDSREMRDVPASFLRYRGTSYQAVVGLALGPDGLYVVPLLPNGRGESVVLRIYHSPETPHPHPISEVPAAGVMWNKGCYGCHSRGEQRQGTFGPPLDAEQLSNRLEARLLSDAYVDSLAALDTLPVLGAPALRDARREVAAADGRDRLHAWVRHKVSTPNFDNPTSAMPTLGLTPSEAEAVAEFLLARPDQPPMALGLVRDVIRRLIPPDPGRRTVVGAFGLGLVVPLASLTVAGALHRRRRARNARG